MRLIEQIEVHFFFFFLDLFGLLVATSGTGITTSVTAGRSTASRGTAAAATAAT